MQTDFMKHAISLVIDTMDEVKGGPFGAVIVKEGKIIAEGVNSVIVHKDPTAHAEMIAIRKACQRLDAFHLNGCDIYSTCEPCPMCLGAIYWARIERIYFGANRKDAAVIGFDDNFFYEELKKPFHQRLVPMEEQQRKSAIKLFKMWSEKEDKVYY
jgi:tRNA(Arg) A34 adenosine deaminase TadA